MVFQRSAILLLAATAALVSADALSVGTQSNVMGKAVKPFNEHKTHEAESPVVQHKKYSHRAVSHPDNNEKAVDTQPRSQVLTATKKTKAHTKVTKEHHKKQSEQAIVGLPKPVEKPTEKPSVKPVGKPEEDDALEEDSGSGSAGMDDVAVGEDEDGVESKDFALPVGASVDVTVDGANITLKHFANGSVVMYANGKVTVLDGKDIYLDFDVEDEEVGSASGSGHGSGHDKAGDGEEVGSKEALLEGEKGVEGSSVFRKFSEFATKLTGNGFKESTPIILIGGALGTLAVVVGIAAVAVRRARANAAIDEPQSVLADGTENAEAGDAAAKEGDAAADESDVLDSSDSESETEVEQEEGKFMSEDTSV